MRQPEKCTEVSRSTRAVSAIQRSRTMAWRLRLMRDVPTAGFRKLGQAVARVTQTFTAGDRQAAQTEANDAAGRDERPEPPVSNKEDDGRDRDREDRREDDETTEEDSDDSTVGTTAKQRLRARHKTRFHRSRDEIYAHHYVYRVLAEAGVYDESAEPDRLFNTTKVTLDILHAVRRLDAEHKRQLLEKIRHAIATGSGPARHSSALFR